MLKGKVAVVTGGSRGIGAAICRKLRESGAAVAILDIICPQEKEEEDLKYYCCDISDFDETTEIFKKIRAEFGGIDILVNNAGITRDKLVLTMKEKDFEEVLAVNLTGAFHTIKQVYPIFAKQRWGKIINITSVAGIMGNPGQANYAASKAGLIGLTKSVARELASRGVCCNAIAPGFVDTEMTQGATLNQELLNSIPLKRMGQPDEIGEMVVFLASEKSDYITGAVIPVDGGLGM